MMIKINNIIYLLIYFVNFSHCSTDLYAFKKENINIYELTIEQRKILICYFDNYLRSFYILEKLNSSKCACPACQEELKEMEEDLNDHRSICEKSLLNNNDLLSLIEQIKKHVNQDYNSSILILESYLKEIDKSLRKNFILQNKSDFIVYT